MCSDSLYSLRRRSTGFQTKKKTNSSLQFYPPKMAPKLLILALLFMAIVASTSASAPAKAPEAAAQSPSNDDIGEVGGDDSGDDDLSPSSDVVEAPVGGPVTEGAFSNLGPSAGAGGSKKNGAAGLEVPAVSAGAAAVAAGFFFLKF